MMKCWDDDPSKRPLFSELKAKLASILIESSQEKYVSNSCMHCDIDIHIHHFSNIDNHGLCKEDC